MREGGRLAKTVHIQWNLYTGDEKKFKGRSKNRGQEYSV